jgi:hypothetical protein
MSRLQKSVLGNACAASTCYMDTYCVLSVRMYVLTATTLCNHRPRFRAHLTSHLHLCFAEGYQCLMAQGHADCRCILGGCKI